jgi:hypothetical protein
VGVSTEAHYDKSSYCEQQRCTFVRRLYQPLACQERDIDKRILAVLRTLNIFTASCINLNDFTGCTKWRNTRSGACG